MTCTKFDIIQNVSGGDLLMKNREIRSQLRGIEEGMHTPKLSTQSRRLDCEQTKHQEFRRSHVSFNEDAKNKVTTNSSESKVPVMTNAR